MLLMFLLVLHVSSTHVIFSADAFDDESKVPLLGDYPKPDSKSEGAVEAADEAGSASVPCRRTNGSATQDLTEDLPAYFELYASLSCLQGRGYLFDVSCAILSRLFAHPIVKQRFKSAVAFSFVVKFLLEVSSRYGNKYGVPDVLMGEGDRVNGETFEKFECMLCDALKLFDYFYSRVESQKIINYEDDVFAPAFDILRERGFRESWFCVCMCE